MRGCALALCALTAAACEREVVPPTQIVVRIEAERGVIDALSALRVRTNAYDGLRWVNRGDQQFDDAVLDWPVDIVVVPKDGVALADRFEVVVAGLDPTGARFVEARALSAFSPHEQRVLTVRLMGCGAGGVCEADGECTGDACSTCSEGTCVTTPFTDPRDLPPFTAPVERDAGSPGGDASAPVADADADADARDAGALDGDVPDDGGALDADLRDDAGCGAGFLDDASQGCVDIDECSLANVCTELLPCRNRPGDYYCRGQFPEAPLDGEQFEVDGDTVRDRVTKLRWQVRVPYDTPGAPMTYAGCTASRLSATEPGTRCTYSEAIRYCEREGVAEHAGTGWRLPTVTELLSIVDDTRSGPAIDTTLFPSTSPGAYWSVSPYLRDPGTHWYIDFDDGATVGTEPLLGDVGFRVRCVKDDP